MEIYLSHMKRLLLVVENKTADPSSKYAVGNLPNSKITTKNKSRNHQLTHSKR